MKRYDVYTDGRGDTIKEECRDGDWVKYEDAQAAIQQAVLAESAGREHPIEGATPEFRAAWIKTRRLEIAATLAEWKRAFFVDGVERPFNDRVTLEAEDAALALEARLNSGAAEAAKVERRKRQNAELLGQLLLILEERGLADVVTEAQRRSSEALENP